MRTVISIQGKNTRLGQLFKTPKYNLLYKGRPAIEQTVEYMSQFGPVHVLGLEGQQAPNLVKLPFLPLIDCFKAFGLEDDTFYVDCDVVPLTLNEPRGGDGTAYLFSRWSRRKTVSEPNNYSNFQIESLEVSPGFSESYLVAINEKAQQYDYCGAGIYFFSKAQDFEEHSDGVQTLAGVFSKMIISGKRVIGDNTSDIFRFGTLHDITGL